MKKISIKTKNKPKWLNSKFKSKPSYDLYLKLRYTLDTYLSRVNSYLFIDYYEWNIFKIDLVKILNVNKKNKLKSILSYDYKVFKTLLFLYWDLEYYLEGQDNVKSIFYKCKDDYKLLNIKLKKKIKSDNKFLKLISIRKPINLWTNLEDLGMLNKIFKYDIYSKIYTLDTKYKNHSKIKTYKLYAKYNNIISYGEIYNIRVIKAIDEKINSVYYNSYIEKWYEEWNSEINKDLTLKYKEKIKSLDNALKELIKTLNKNDETNV